MPERTQYELKWENKMQKSQISKRKFFNGERKDLDECLHRGKKGRKARLAKAHKRRIERIQRRESRMLIREYV